MTSTITEPAVDRNNISDAKAPWGVSVCVDCYDCDPHLIRSPQAVKQFVNELIHLIDMRAYGDCHVVNFGEDERVAGLSMFQFIETSCISGHFANQTNTAYIDIFSCKPFDTDIAADFCMSFFKGKKVIKQSHRRK